jgi:hypothetical protein
MADSEWNTRSLPEEGVVVHVLAMDRRGRYMIPFRVVFRDGRWWTLARENSSTLLSWDGAESTGRSGAGRTRGVLRHNGARLKSCPSQRPQDPRSPRGAERAAKSDALRCVKPMFERILIPLWRPRAGALLAIMRV